jgi:hypothetical protein
VTSDHDIPLLINWQKGRRAEWWNGEELYSRLRCMCKNLNNETPHPRFTLVVLLFSLIRPGRKTNHPAVVRQMPVHTKWALSGSQAFEIHDQ